MKALIAGAFAVWLILFLLLFTQQQPQIVSSAMAEGEIQQVMEAAENLDGNMSSGKDTFLEMRTARLYREWREFFLVIQAILIVALFLPFIPMFLEIFRPKDDSRLFINMNYSKDPLFFIKSFTAMLKKHLVTDKPGVQEIKLNKKELVDVIADFKIFPRASVYEKLLYITGDMVSEKGASFYKEVYVDGMVHVGEGNTVRALASEDDIILSPRTSIMRWVGTEGSITVAEDCDLGSSVAAKGALTLHQGCTFKSLYGNPINTGEGFRGFSDRKPVWHEEPFLNESTMINIPSDKRLLRVVDEDETVEGDLITNKNLDIRSGAVIKGSIKSGRMISLGSNVVVLGNVFSEDEIVIGDGCIVRGNIFSQSTVRVGRGVVIGRRKSVKSIIAKNNIEIFRDVTVHGYILTYGIGVVR